MGSPGAARPGPPGGPPPPPATPSGPAGLQPAAAPAGPHEQAPARPPDPGRWSRATSPGWYRVWAVATAAVLAVLCAVGSLAASRSASSARTIRNEAGPALLGVQDLFASESEANAAATAVVLTGADGAEDRARLNLYVDAVNRSAAQTVTLAGLVGDDQPSQDALRRTAAALTTYTGSVEAARRENALNGPNASADLQAALGLAGTDMTQAVGTVTDGSRARFDGLRSQGNLLLGATALVAVAALAVLARLQRGTLARSNRLLNLPMLAATALVVIDLGALAVAGATRSSALGQADSNGYQAVQATSALQSQAFQLQSDLSLRLLNGSPTDAQRQADLTAKVNQNLDVLSRQADTTREDAALTELRTRWDRYQQAAAAVPVQTTGSRRTEAINQFEGPVLSTFNGFNTTIESVLLDNRTQFTGGVNRAAGSVGWLPWVAAILPLLAAAAMVAGVQQRLGDYK